MVLIIAIFFHNTIFGVYQYSLAKWDEDAFKGRPLQELRQHLARRNKFLEPSDPVGFKGITGRPVGPNEKIMQFIKGRSYRWLPIGQAQNIGFVVIQETDDGEIVVDVLRTVEVDTL